MLWQALISISFAPNSLSKKHWSLFRRLFLNLLDNCLSPTGCSKLELGWRKYVAMFSNTSGSSLGLPLHIDVYMFSIFPINVLDCLLITPRISPLRWSWSTTQSSVSRFNIGHLLGSFAFRHSASLLTGMYDTSFFC